MADIIKQEAKDSKTVENTTAVNKEAPSPQMITIPQVKAQDFLIGLTDALTGVEDLKSTASDLAEQRKKELDLFESQIIKKLNALYESTSSLQKSLECKENYENYLEERIKNTALENDVVMLERHLEKEKLEYHTFIDLLKTKVIELESADKIIKKNVEDFGNEIQGIVDAYSNQVKEANDSYSKSIKVTYEKHSDNLDEKLNEFGKGVMEKYTSHYEALKISSQKLLSEYVNNCKNNTDTMKNAALDFLKQCQIQNKELIAKIPKVKQNKFELKDILIIILSGTSIIGMLVSYLFM